MGKTVLVMDDSRTVRAQLSRVLSGAGHRVVEAKHGVEGIQRLREHPDIALVFADVIMPVMNGIEFVQAARAEGFGVPVVMVTTESGKRTTAAAKAAGAVGWIIKPFIPHVLLNAVNVLAKRSPHASNEWVRSEPQIDLLQLLLVDDDDAERIIFTKAISPIRPDVSVLALNGGPALLRHLRNEDVPHPHLVVIDINMPTMCGIQLLKEIKSDPKLQHLNTILWSTSAPQYRYLEARASGATEVHGKPFDFSDIQVFLGDLCDTWFPVQVA